MYFWTTSVPSIKGCQYRKSTWKWIEVCFIDTLWNVYSSGFHTQRSEFLVVGLFLLRQFPILFSLLINSRRKFKEKFHLLTSVAVNFDRAGFSRNRSRGHGNCWIWYGDTRRGRTREDVGWGIMPWRIVVAGCSKNTCICWIRHVNSRWRRTCKDGGGGSCHGGCRITFQSIGDPISMTGNFIKSFTQRIEHAGATPSNKVLDWCGYRVERWCMKLDDAWESLNITNILLASVIRNVPYFWLRT